MRWRKLGRVYCPDGRFWWARSHAMIPTPVVLRPDRIRIYISCCDDDNVARVGYVEVAADDPTRVLSVRDEPVLDIGERGAFDDNGVVACTVLPIEDGSLLLYYVGFELCHRIRYRLFTGLAISQDDGESFVRVQRTPVLDRSDDELYFRCGPHVVLDRGTFRMWYVAGSAWTKVGGKDVPVYDIRYATSEDGRRWPNVGQICIPVTQSDEHGFGRPIVVGRDGGYDMFYSIRSVSQQAYRMGFATSSDAIKWNRCDADMGLDVSREGWDAEAVCYAAPVIIDGRRYIFYNGNQFGRTGFGVAVDEDPISG